MERNMTDPATPPADLQRYVAEASAAIGLSIAAQDMPAVVAIFANLARVAAPLMEFPLPADAEPSPVFTAGGTQR
jgi:hypothetical protein